MSTEKFGLQSNTVDQLHSVFHRYPTIERVLIYGSRAKGNYREGSDIDLTLVGKGISTEDILRIENEIDDLMLPYKVDLSVLSKIENSALIDHIRRIGVEFYRR